MLSHTSSKDRHKARVCQLCGKVETNHWIRHWAHAHPMSVPKELGQGERPMAPYRQDWFEFLPSHFQMCYLGNDAAKINSVANGTPEVPLISTETKVEGMVCQESIIFPKIQGFDSPKFKCVPIEDGANAADAAIDPEESIPLLLNLACHALGKLSRCL